jgi:hypothetical protein
LPFLQSDIPTSGEKKALEIDLIDMAMPVVE